MMIYTTKPELVRAAALVTSTEETRYYLRGVHFCEADQGGLYIVSTNGHRMSVGYDPDGWIDGKDSESIIAQFPRDFLKHLTPKRESILLMIDDGTAEVIAARNGETLAMAKVDFIDGTFPDWRRVIKADESTACYGGFNPSYLADYKAVASALGVKGVLSLTGPDDKAPHIVRLSGADNWFGMIMPMRGGKTGLPEWYGPKAEAEAIAEAA